MAQHNPSNDTIADMLVQIADLLEAQDDSNTFRIRAYRNAATSLRATKESVAKYVHDDDIQALEAIPGIGNRIAHLVEEYVDSGHANLLERLQGEVTPEATFARVPGIGEELAERIAKKLDIDSLEDLEEAAHNGKLATVEGFGERRVEAVKAALGGMLSKSASRRGQAAAKSATRAKSAEPSVEDILKVDEDYRKRAKDGKLKTIAPRRFNPDHEAWLPIMHVDRDGWSYTAMFSNTARAHELEKTDDWVVIYFEKDGKEKQCTVVTETAAPLKDKRVVRGREDESLEHYTAKSKS